MHSFTNVAALILRTWPTGDIQVRGHSDATESPAGSQTLSERRAAAVADLLAGHGVDRSRLTTIGFGATRPIVLETTADGADNPLAGSTTDGSRSPSPPAERSDAPTARAGAAQPPSTSARSKRTGRSSWS